MECLFVSIQYCLCLKHFVAKVAGIQNFHSFLHHRIGGSVFSLDMPLQIDKLVAAVRASLSLTQMHNRLMSCQMIFFSKRFRTNIAEKFSWRLDIVSFQFVSLKVVKLLIAMFTHLLACVSFEYLMGHS